MGEASRNTVTAQLHCDGDRRGCGGWEDRTPWGRGRDGEGGGDRADKGNLGRSSPHVAEEGGGEGGALRNLLWLLWEGRCWRPEGGGDGQPVNRLWKHPISPSAGPQARGRWGRLRASGVGSLLLGSVREGGNPGQVCERVGLWSNCLEGAPAHPRRALPGSPAV